MKKIFALLTLVPAFAMAAENLVTDTACGNVNKSLMVCLSKNETTGTTFIKIVPFVPAGPSKTTFSKVEKIEDKTEGRLGATTMEYTSSVVILNDDSYMEESLVLEIVTTMVPGFPMKGTLIRNGKRGNTFDMKIAE